ncbi:MAG: GNAT family N-acetyltransferase [Bacteroidales bacterium]|jgi:ribosomal protein S18 acetylase RimI-like enzyme|nr:GNAT family N-acetyltransferase [Bacteroidales bacterium]
MEIQIYDSYSPMAMLEKKKIIDFLHQHLDEFGDTKEAIKKAIDYSIGESSPIGGFVVVGTIDNKMAGAVVVNRTGMEDYIPENILVYIAVDSSLRGKGIGKQLMKKAIDLSKGNIALHVEANNPALFLYEKFGFTSKYLEYRLIRK